MTDSDPGTDLVATTPAVREARIALRDAPLEDIKELHDRAVAAEAYAKAKQDREAYLVAAEVKLWSERAAGAIRRQLPRRHGIEPRFDRDEARSLREQGLTQRQVGERLGVDKSAIGYAERNGWGDGIKGVPVKEFDEELGVPTSVAYNWEKIAELSDERFAELVEEAKEHDAALTASGILRRAGRSYETRVEPGIYRMRDGRLSLRFQREGVGEMRILEHNDIAKARRELAQARGAGRGPVIRNAVTIGDGYQLVVRALETLERLDVKDFDPELAEAIGLAIASLHSAEDRLLSASKKISRRRK